LTKIKALIPEEGTAPPAKTVLAEEEDIEL